VRLRRNTRGSSTTTIELTQRGERLRRRRLQRGVGLADAAAELGVPTKILRAIEWDRDDLLANHGDADRIQRDYASFLGLDETPPLPESGQAASAPRRTRRGLWALLLTGLARYRQPLFLVGIGIAVAVAVFTLLSVLT
jgi:cytoskeletal protein RodZ